MEAGGIGPPEGNIAAGGSLGPKPKAAGVTGAAIGLPFGAETPCMAAKLLAAARVWPPTTPSGLSPKVAWKALVACSVCRPNLPSGLRGPKPRALRLFCQSATAVL